MVRITAPQLQNKLVYLPEQNFVSLLSLFENCYDLFARFTVSAGLLRIVSGGMV